VASRSLSATQSPQHDGKVSPQLTFPSLPWFRRLAELMDLNRSVHEHVGEVDCTCVFTVLDASGPGEDRHFQVTFEWLSVTDVREVSDEQRLAADFIMETDLQVWTEMLENIARNDGRPDLEHSLNHLSLPGVPMRVWAADPLGRDMFFRFNGSLQEFINASAHIPTRYEE
jgi:hypothetical protein